MLSHVLDEHPEPPTWLALPATTEPRMGTPAKVRSLGTSGLSYQWKPQRPSRPLLGLTKAPIDIGGDPDGRVAEKFRHSL